MNNSLSRRRFLSNTAIGAIGTVGVTGLLTSCAGSKNKHVNYKLPEILNEAPDGKVLKAGLIGCGGRGTGAAMNFIDAGPNLQIVALGDLFKDKLDDCRATLKRERNIEIDESYCFTGFDNYLKVIDSGIDIVLLCTPPHFRPIHVEAAVNAGKHIFMEKPVAVDPVGARSVLISAKKAEQM